MCQFCVEHGEGKRWYLEASNYALDLNSDLARRDYVVDFISGFEQMRSRAVTAGNVLGKLPRPIAQLGKDAITRHQQANHFGQPLSLEDCEQVLDIASSITVIPCICRHARARPHRRGSLRTRHFVPGRQRAWKRASRTTTRVPISTTSTPCQSRRPWNSYGTARTAGCSTRSGRSRRRSRRRSATAIWPAAAWP